MKLIEVTGLDAARRQLETAVTLVFQDGDIVSIHTLGAAAREILERIDRSQGGVGGGVGLLNKQSGDWFRKVQNFFKHANKPDAKVEFADEHTYLTVLDACHLYRRLVKERVPILRAFEVWAAMSWASDLYEKKFTEKYGPEVKEMLKRTKDFSPQDALAICIEFEKQIASGQLKI